MAEPKDKLTPEDRAELERLRTDFLRPRPFETDPINVDEFMNVMMTGEEAYKVLAHVLFRWNALTGADDDYVYWLATELYNDPALEKDWAYALRNALKDRAEGKVKPDPVRPAPFEKDDIDVDKLMNTKMTGREAYRALGHVLFRWKALTNADEYVYKFAPQLYTEPTLQMDWAYAIRNMLKDKAEGRRMW